MYLKEINKVQHFENFYQRNILLLQGPIGPFFQELEDRLIENKNKVKRIIFNAGDNYFSKSKNKILFSGDVESWNDFFEDFIIVNEIDLVMMMGDSRMYHNTACKILNILDIEYFVFEQGYLRPNFITFEKQGVNFNSKTIPKHIGIFKQMHFEYSYKHNILKNNNSIKNNYFYLLKYTIIYGLCNYLNRSKFSSNDELNNYNLSFFRDGFKYVFGKLNVVFNKYKTKQFIKYIKENKFEKYFFVPLQLSNDTQIQLHSKYNDMFEFINEIMTSFSKHGKKEDFLIIKVHPLEIGLDKYNNYIKDLSKELNLDNRVLYIKDGPVGDLLQYSKGIITINSTVGISALYHLKPIKAMGKSIYNLDELTFSKSLDDFWKDPLHPNEQLVSNFINYILYYTQIPGSFYIPNNVISD
jgi:capsular polysaccharide export protein